MSLVPCYGVVTPAWKHTPEDHRRSSIPREEVIYRRMCLCSRRLACGKPKWTPQQSFPSSVGTRTVIQIGFTIPIGVEGT